MFTLAPTLSKTLKKYLFRYLFNLLHKKRNSLSEDVHGKMIDQMMIPIHAIVSSEELEGHHVHTIRAVHLFFKKHLQKEEQKNSRHGRFVHDILDRTFDLENHYFRFGNPYFRFEYHYF